MFSTLLTESLVQKDVSFLASFPSEFLEQEELKCVQWVLKYTSHNSRTPSPQRMQKTQFAHLVDKRFLIHSPLRDVFDLALDHKKRIYFLSKVRDMELEVDEGKSVDNGKLLSIAKAMSMGSVRGTESLSSIDRDLMYSESHVSKVFSFGFPGLDKETGGIQAGEYALLSARIGSGKTWLLCYFAKLWAFQGNKVLLISNEMPIEQIMARVDAMIAGFNPILLRTKEDPVKLLKMKEKVLNIINTDLKSVGGDIIIPKKRCGSPLEMIHLAEEHKVDIICVDGVYLMNPSTGKGGIRWERIASVSNELKQVCLDTGIPTLATTQLKRQGNEAIVNLESLAYADALGQDADMVFALQPDSVSGNKNFTLSIVKNRHGQGLGVNVMGKIDYDTMDIKEEII